MMTKTCGTCGVITKADNFCAVEQEFVNDSDEACQGWLERRPWHIASISWGKDSLAMLFKLISEGSPLDEVVFYDTGMEFEAIYEERNRFVPGLLKHGVKYTELRPETPMWWDMFTRPVQERKEQKKPNPINTAFDKAGMLPEGIHYGYGWCGGLCRWGTTAKNHSLDKYAEALDAVVYVGIAVDETDRLEKETKPYKLHPLKSWGMTEKDCLELCYEKGATWEQDGVRLYDILDRVSCWCCRNKNQRELQAIHDHLPRYWKLLRGLEETLGQMKTKPLALIGGE